MWNSRGADRRDAFAPGKPKEKASSTTNPSCNMLQLCRNLLCPSPSQSSLSALSLRGPPRRGRAFRKHLRKVSTGALLFPNPTTSLITSSLSELVLKNPTPLSALACCCALWAHAREGAEEARAMLGASLGAAGTSPSVFPVFHTHMTVARAVRS